ncbi:hypothetical protein [Vibrio splendidus]|uniref:Uncharacterized protein n=2 Tax=Vibrio splendidus TaxID=29497 RepID=A0A2T5DVY0_VIBSP|nr:hypothetical protein [Vibrio splendidus]OEE73170.1 hypothetical protein A147_09975 [Vibrio splendidus FF-6]PTP10533.1 hypothetical protein CWO36_25770 [Vibrio splendidus]
MEDQVMKSDELQEVINWLHNDVDKAVDDANDVVAKRQYKKVFDSLELLKEMLLMSESNNNYVQMLGYRDDTDQVQCMVSNVVGLNFQEVNELADEIFLVGDWFMSVTSVDKDENHNVKIYGPYETDQQAMEYARKTLSVTTFRISV